MTENKRAENEGEKAENKGEKAEKFACWHCGCSVMNEHPVFGITCCVCGERQD